MQKNKSKKPHILFLYPSKDVPGGVVEYVETLRKRLSNAVESNQLIIGASTNKNRRLNTIVKPLNDACKLSYILFRKEVAVVHINPSFNLKSIIRDGLFLFVCKLHRFDNVYIQYHGWEEDLFKKLIQHRLLCKLYAWLYGWVKEIGVLSSEIRNDLVSLGIDQRIVFHATTMFDGDFFAGIKRKRFDDKVQLLFLSRFVKSKGVYETLESFFRLRKNHPELRLVLAGDGPEAAGMREYVNKFNLQAYVVFTGYVKGETKAQIFCDADIFVFPTSSEGCPVSLLEAMAAGLPVVTTTAGGIGDIVTDGENGYLLQAVDPQLIDIAIINLLRNRDALRNMGRHNKKVAWEKYESIKLAKKIEEKLIFFSGKK